MYVYIYNRNIPFVDDLPLKNGKLPVRKFFVIEDICLSRMRTICAPQAGEMSEFLVSTPPDGDPVAVEFWNPLACGTDLKNPGLLIFLGGQGRIAVVTQRTMKTHRLIIMIPTRVKNKSTKITWVSHAFLSSQDDFSTHVDLLDVHVRPHSPIGIMQIANTNGATHINSVHWPLSDINMLHLSSENDVKPC